MFHSQFFCTSCPWKRPQQSEILQLKFFYVFPPRKDRNYLPVFKKVEEKGGELIFINHLLCEKCLGNIHTHFLNDWNSMGFQQNNFHITLFPAQSVRFSALGGDLGPLL